MGIRNTEFNSVSARRIPHLVAAYAPDAAGER